MTPPRLIVTRPAREAEQWVQQLRQRGLVAEALPLIEIAPVTDEAQVKQLDLCRQQLASYTACMFVSGNAADCFFQLNRPPAQTWRGLTAIKTIADGKIAQLPPGLRLMAPGPGTVAALVQSGVPAAQIDAPPADAGQFDSESLWQVVGGRDWRGSRVLIVRGHSLDAAGEPAAAPGREWLARQLADAGATVEFVAVYQRRPPVLTDTQQALARAASHDGSVWLFSSSEALAGLPALDWRHARAIATHPRIEDSVRAAGWGVVVASRPALADIEAVVRSIESTHP